MKVLTLPRHSGKTTIAMEWVQEGVRTSGYPGWTRVLVVSNRKMLLNMKQIWWSTTEDFDHRVYTFYDWDKARGVNIDTEVVIDNAELIFPGFPGTIVGVTVTGEPWDVSE